jgi:CHAD domain-containing protein
MTRPVLVSPGELGLPAKPLTAAADDPPERHVRARLDQQVRVLLEQEAIAREGADPEGVHQMRVAVRRMRAALKASGEPGLEDLQAELRWLGGILARIRDLDVLLGHLRAQAADLSTDEQAAVELLLRSLVDERRRARRRMLDTFRANRYAALLRTLANTVTADAAGGVAGDVNGYPVRRKPGKQALLDVVVKPHRKLAKAAGALDAEPADDELHALRIQGKRLRYAAELAEPVGGKPVRRLIRATKEFQDILGDHQDTVVAEEEVRRLLTEQTDPVAGFVAGRLVERERARRADCRARWRAAFDEVDRLAGELR